MPIYNKSRVYNQGLNTTDSPTFGYLTADTITSFCIQNGNSSGWSAFGSAYINKSGTTDIVKGLDIAIHCDPNMFGTANITNAYGIYNKIISKIYIGGSSTITNAYGYYSQIGSQYIIGGTSLITNVYNSYLANFVAEAGGVAKSVTNLYQLYIEKPTWGSSINKAIYVAGGECEIHNGTLTSSMIENTDSDTNEIDSVVFAGGFGMIIAASVTDGTSAIWKLKGTTFEAIEVDVDWTSTKDNAATYNVYIESGSIKLQNKVGDNKSVKLGYFGI